MVCWIFFLGTLAWSWEMVVLLLASTPLAIALSMANHDVEDFWALT